MINLAVDGPMVHEFLLCNGVEATGQTLYRCLDFSLHDLKMAVTASIIVGSL